jgi:hypothetical protein
MTEPYRSDVEATADRLVQLEEELRALDRAADRREELLREVEKLRAHLASARAQGPLEDLHIASPCDQAWEQMVGDDRVRHCASCDKDVFNVAAMTRVEALQLITDQSGEVPCLRLFRRDDGTVLTSDCPVGVRKKRVRRLVMVGASVAAGSLAGAAGGLWFWSEDPEVITTASPAASAISSTLTVPTGSADAVTSVAPLPEWKGFTGRPAQKGPQDYFDRHRPKPPRPKPVR